MGMGDSEHEIDGIVQYETCHPEWDVWYDWSNDYYDKSTLPDHNNNSSYLLSMMVDIILMSVTSRSLINKFSLYCLDLRPCCISSRVA
jgi:hypothetical protein